MSSPIRWSTLRVASVALIAATALGCEGLLEVGSDPHVVSADEQRTLQESVVGATVDLYFAFDSKISWAGLFGDEFVNSGTAPAIQRFDQRDVPEDHGTGDFRGRGLGGAFYLPIQRAVQVAHITQGRISEGDFEELSEGTTESAEYARVSAYEGFAKTWLADLYCEMAFHNDGPVHTTLEAYGLAEEEFTRAIEAENASPAIRQAAYVGRARVRLQMGDQQGALSDAGQVDPEFELLAEYSTNTYEQRNRIWVHVWDVSNWSVGPDFRNLEIDDTGESDPRVELVLNPTPAFEPSQPLWAPLKVDAPSSPLRIATGDEAQYLIAEIQGGSDAVDIINEIRGRHGIDEEWSPSGGDPNEIRNKVIDERKRTLFLDGVRLGDLRRYLRQYDLNFFPQSTPQGFPMGDQTCLPLPSVERENNPGIG